MSNNKVKTIQLHQGADLIGAKMSITDSRNLKLELTPVGVEVISSASGRRIIVPFSNLKIIEMLPEGEVKGVSASVAARTQAALELGDMADPNQSRQPRQGRPGPKPQVKAVPIVADEAAVQAAADARAAARAAARAEAIAQAEAEKLKAK